VPDKNAVLSAKAAMREYAIVRRRHAVRQAGPASASAVRGMDHFLAAIRVAPGAVVSGYFPVREEFDVMPLMGRLARAGIVCALPVIERRNAPLLFRAWRSGAALAQNPFSIPEPLDDAEVVVPNVLLVPLLAFDSEGYRLGYGGGYYDRTLNTLRATGDTVLAVGMAFTEQQVDHVPHQTYDEKLDWVVSERGAMPITQSGEAARA